MDLVEKTIDFPAKYRAIPIKSALSLLHEQKSMQIHELEALTTQVLLNYDQNKKNNKVEEQPNFILVPRKNQLITRVKTAISKSKKIIRIITSWKRHLEAVITYENVINQAFSRDVKIKVLITESPKEKKIPKTARRFNNHSNTSIKFTDSPAQIIEIIIDNKEALLMTAPKANLADSPALWSNNPSLILALTTCFDTTWKEA